MGRLRPQSARRLPLPFLPSASRVLLPRPTGTLTQRAEDEIRFRGRRKTFDTEESRRREMESPPLVFHQVFSQCGMGWLPFLKGLQVAPATRLPPRLGYRRRYLHVRSFSLGCIHFQPMPLATGRSDIIIFWSQFEEGKYLYNRWTMEEMAIFI